MSKFLITTSILFATLFSAFGQERPVHWSIDTDFDADGNTIIIVTADIDPTWKIYSNQTEEGGPIPTEITFETPESTVLKGTYAEAGDAHVEFSELFDMQVATFTENASFIQLVDTFKGGDIVKATVTYMCCSGNQCLPPIDVELSVRL